MVKIKRVIFISSIIAFAFLNMNCLSTNSELQNCNELHNGLLEKDNLTLKPVFDDITNDLSPTLIESDNLGHKANFDILIKRINDCKEVKASLKCYGCVETFPLQSEISVLIDSSGIQVERVIDILTSEKSSLKFVRVH